MLDGSTTAACTTHYRESSLMDSELFSVMSESLDEVMVCGVGRVVTDDRVIVLCDYVTSCGVSTQHGTITHSCSVTRHLRV